jgi:hypothetical protein
VASLRFPSDVRGALNSRLQKIHIAKHGMLPICLTTRRARFGIAKVYTIIDRREHDRHPTLLSCDHQQTYRLAIS